MDNKSSQKRNDGNLTKPSIVSPVKDRHRKITLGFRGFKIINSNIKLVKEVDVKTPVLKPKTTSEATNTGATEPSISPQKNLTTAKSLKQLSEKIQSKDMLDEEIYVGTLDRDTVDVLPNGIHGENVVVSPTKDSTVGSSEPKSSDKPEITKTALQDMNSETRSTEVKNHVKSDSVKSRDLQSPVKDRKDGSKRKHSSERSDKKARSETSTSPRGYEYKCDSRKKSERSKSPHRVREHRSSKTTSYSSSTDRSRSPRHNRDYYSSSKRSTSLQRPSHHSRKREPTCARKYSASHKSRSNASSNSGSRSRHGHRKRTAYGDDDNDHRRSSSHRRSSPERNTSSKQNPGGRTSTESRDFISSKDNSRSSHSRSSDEYTKQTEQKITCFVEDKKHSNTDELFSKLSFASLNEDEEDFVQDVGSSPRKATDNDVEAVDTDFESFSAPNDTEDSEVDTACEDELPQCKIIDQIDTDTVDSFSTAPEVDTDPEDGESSIQDMKFNAVKSEAARSGLCHEASYLELYEKMNSECRAGTSFEEGDELNKIDELCLKTTGASAASFEMNSNIACDVPVPQNLAVVNDLQEDVSTPPETSKAESSENENKAFSIEMSSENTDFSSVVETPSQLTLDTKHIKKEHIQITTGNLSNFECFSSLSEKSPIRSTPYVKDCPPPPRPVLQRDPRKRLLKPAAENVSSPENKIPTIASQLKDVFKSLLRTDFKADEEEKAENAPKLNGIIFLNKINLPKCDDVRENKQSAQDSVKGVDTMTVKVTEPPANRPDFLEHDVTNARKDTGNSQSDMASDIQNNESDSIDVFTSCQTPTHNTGSVTTVPKFSPDEASSYKLKLHATTKTPLPAKKSYIQRVQSNSNSSKTSSPEPELFSLATKLLVPSDGGVSSGVETLEVKPIVNFTDADQSRKDGIIKSDSHCEEGISTTGSEGNVKHLLLSSGLSRRDSSESSTNDNEEGPRRSARIRTKKTERTLKKQLCCETAPNQNPLVANNASDNTELVKSAINSQHEMTERLSKDLSGEELFRARIRVASDVDDCPDPFELLDENLYLMSMKKSRARKEIRRMVCDCALEDTPDPGGPCGENCLNRLLMIECSSRCHYGNRCTNKRFQHRIYAPTEVFKTSFKGWGIRAATDIELGQLLMEYCGEVMDQREFTRRSLEYSKSKHAHFYFMALSQDELIDATYKGNSSRFINHSCDPNAETQKWTVNGRLRVGFFTLRRLEKGEEITFDYQFERYGKVAQKCFCGTTKCRGYLGKAPDEDDTKLSKLLSNEALSPYDDASNDDLQEQDPQKKKKLAYFTDNTMEKDISKLLGGLRSSKEVLTLSRLMVRCETHAQRIMCLQVLNETTSQTRLKTFLQFHGLSIIWIWMVDIGTIEDTDSLALKLEIINTLCILPITNKNVIEDSKVLSVVQRWAKPETTEEKAISQEEGSPKEDEAVKTENTDGAVQSEVDDDKEKVEPVTQEPKVRIVPTDGEVAKKPTSDDTSDYQTENNEVKRNEKVLSAAASLLDSWKDLKEIYRIPKRQKPLPSPNQDSNSRDNSVSLNSSPSSRQNRTDDSEHRAIRYSRSRRESSQERFRDGFDRSLDYKYRDRRTDLADIEFSPGSSNSSENRKEAGRRKRRFSTDSDDTSRDLPWHCRPPRNSNKMSRQEHRKRFEKDAQKRERQKKNMEQQMGVEIAQNVMYPIASQQYISSMVEDIQPLMGQDLSMVEQAMSATATFTPSGFSGNLIQINPTQSTQLMLDPYFDAGLGQQVGIMPQVVQQLQDPYQHMQVPIQQNYDITAVYGQDPNLHPGTFCLNDPNLVGQQHMNHPGQQIFTNNSVNMVQPLLQQQQSALMQPQQQPANNVTILGSQNGQAIVLLSAEQLQKLTQGITSAPKQPVQSENSSEKKLGKPDYSESDAPKNKAPQKLPPNWKTATDTEGRVYYYHVITRQTQWDPPTWDGKEEDMVGKKEAEMDLSSTPTHDERRFKSSKNKNDGVTEEGRKAKETFRLRMSQFVVTCLSSYRKPDKKVGRIISTEDFKHLARKLTHNIMEKELKQVRILEDLDFNANVKYKTKEYVKKYMSKVGPIYKIKDDT